MSAVARSEAIKIAKRAAGARGLPWIEPTYVAERIDEFEISSNAEVLGGNVVVVVGRAKGEVRSVESFDR